MSFPEKGLTYYQASVPVTLYVVGEFDMDFVDRAMEHATQLFHKVFSTKGRRWTVATDEFGDPEWKLNDKESGPGHIVIEGRAKILVNVDWIEAADEMEARDRSIEDLTSLFSRLEKRSSVFIYVDHDVINSEIDLEKM